MSNLMSLWSQFKIMVLKNTLGKSRLLHLYNIMSKQKITLVQSVVNGYVKELTFSLMS